MSQITLLDTPEAKDALLALFASYGVKAKKTDEGHNWKIIELDFESEDY